MKFLLPLLAAATSLQADDAQWLRYPAISPDGKTIVFTHGGDLYTVPSTGGQAFPLTQHVARDFMPVWSPDGQSIAFASDRHGNLDVFKISAQGGAATRLTFFSKDDIPSSFTQDGSAVLFQSVRQDSVNSLDIPNRRIAELYQVPSDGGRVERLFSTPAEDVNFSPSGNRFLYHDKKGYEDPWRKHHVSSITRDIWLYDVGEKSHRKITDFRGEDRNPVWIDEENFLYLSEQSGSFNIWQRPVAPDGVPAQVTKFEKHPVRFLSRSNEGQLAFGFHGGIYHMSDLGSEPKKLSITIRAGEKTNSSLVSYASAIKEMAVSPDGSEIAFIARGEVFVTSVDYQTTRRVTNTPEQERSVHFHPDGDKIVYASERDGSWNLYTSEIVREEESFFYESTSLEEKILLKTDAETFQPQWSPDGTMIAFIRDRVQLCLLEVESGKVTELLDGSRSYSYTDGDLPFKWSPDSQNILFMLLQKERWAENLMMVPIDGSPVIDVSKNGYYDMDPNWGWDGEGAIWVSNRHGRKAHGSWGTDLDVYVGFLTERAHRLFKMNEAERDAFDEKEDDQEEADESKEAEEKEEEKGEKKLLFSKPQPLDPETAFERTERLTIHSTEISSYVVSPDAKALYYLTLDRGKHQIWVHKFYEEETKLLTTLGSVNDRDPADLTINKEGDTLFVLSGGKISTVSTSDGKTEKIDDGGEMNLDLATERKEMFEHVWRQVREKFHRTDFHGADWDFYGAEYRKFLPGITNNDDFAEMLSEMLGELDASHTGAFHRPKRKGADKTASLGVFYDFSYQGPGIKILGAIPRSPLDLLDEEIPAGSVIEKINGKEIPAGENFFKDLNRLAGERTLLSFHDSKADKRWEVIIRPISLASEMELLYQRWLKRMRAKAEELSGGKIGWVHIRGMNDGAFREFFSRVFGFHSDKKALIVDTRFNGGGWLSEDLTAFLTGKQYLKFFPRGQKNMGGQPIFRWSRPSAVIMSEGNYSDAHMFPYAFKAMGIGKLIGMPVPGTGTAVWWERLIDSSVIFGIPQVSTIDTEGRYLENTELQPDIKVTSTPEEREQGVDRQLEEAVKHLMSLPDQKEWPLPRVATLSKPDADASKYLGLSQESWIAMTPMQRFEKLLRQVDGEANDQKRAESFNLLIHLASPKALSKSEELEVAWTEIATISTGQAEQLKVIKEVSKIKEVWVQSILDYFIEDSR